jgi:hypothetical protein
MASYNETEKVVGRDYRSRNPMEGIQYGVTQGLLAPLPLVAIHQKGFLEFFTGRDNTERILDYDEGDLETSITLQKGRVIAKITGGRSEPSLVGLGMVGYNSEDEPGFTRLRFAVMADDPSIDIYRRRASLDLGKAPRFAAFYTPRKRWEYRQLEDDASEAIADAIYMSVREYAQHNDGRTDPWRGTAIKLNNVGYQAARHAISIGYLDASRGERMPFSPH